MFWILVRMAMLPDNVVEAVETVLKMPTLAESAWNSSNSVYEMQNEVQLMAAISMKYQHHGGKADWPKLAEKLCLGGPLQSYINAVGVGMFVQMHGGPRVLHVCFHNIGQTHWATHLTCICSNVFNQAHRASCCLSSFKGPCLSSQSISCLSSLKGSMAVRHQLVL